ncbi:MAG: hypothetical protein R6U66_06425 [Bacteroidales bacterium]
MKQFHTNTLILAGILTLAVLAAGCATKQTPHTVETNEKKEVHLRTEHLFYLEKHRQAVSRHSPRK